MRRVRLPRSTSEPKTSTVKNWKKIHVYIDEYTHIRAYMYMYSRKFSHAPKKGRLLPTTAPLNRGMYQRVLLLHYAANCMGPSKKGGLCCLADRTRKGCSKNWAPFCRVPVNRIVACGGI